MAAEPGVPAAGAVRRKELTLVDPIRAAPAAVRQRWRLAALAARTEKISSACPVGPDPGLKRDPEPLLKSDRRTRRLANEHQPGLAHRGKALYALYASYTPTVVEQSQGRVKALSVGGAAPTAQNVQSKKYVLTRDSFLVTKAAPSPSVSRFLEFVRSSDGEKVIMANGAVPAK